jgi:hypothetical protein
MNNHHNKLFSLVDELKNEIRQLKAKNLEKTQLEQQIERLKVYICFVFIFVCTVLFSFFFFFFLFVFFLFMFYLFVCFLFVFFVCLCFFFLFFFVSTLQRDNDQLKELLVDKEELANTVGKQNLILNTKLHK